MFLVPHSVDDRRMCATGMLIYCLKIIFTFVFASCNSVFSHTLSSLMRFFSHAFLIFLLLFFLLNHLWSSICHWSSSSLCFLWSHWSSYPLVFLLLWSLFSLPPTGLPFLSAIGHLIAVLKGLLKVPYLCDDTL